MATISLPFRVKIIQGFVFKQHYVPARTFIWKKKWLELGLQVVLLKLEIRFTPWFLMRHVEALHQQPCREWIEVLILII